MSSFFQSFVASKIVQEHRILCPNCSRYFWILAKKPGQRIICPKCGKSFHNK